MFRYFGWLGGGILGGGGSLLYAKQESMGLQGLQQQVFGQPLLSGLGNQGNGWRVELPPRLDAAFLRGFFALELAYREYLAGKRVPSE